MKLLVLNALLLSCALADYNAFLPTLADLSPFNNELIQRVFFAPSKDAVYGTCLSVPFQHAQYSFALSLNISVDLGWRQAMDLTKAVSDIVNTGIDGLNTVCISRQQFVASLGLSYPTCINRFYLLSLGNTDFYNVMVYNHLYKHLEFVCSSGFDVYQYNFNCIKQGETSDTYIQCFQQFNQSINNDPSNFCGITQDLTSCINNFYTGSCDPWVGWMECEMERYGFAEDCPNFLCAVNNNN